MRAIATTFFACASFGQQFEVATIKPSAPGATGCVIRPTPGGERYVAECLPVRIVLWTAFWIKSSQVIGGPAWLDTDRYDITGLAGRPTGINDLHSMMQNLLIDRFHLKFHHETRELPAYVLTVDKNGPKNLNPQVASNGSDLRIDVERDGLRQKWSAKFAPMAFFTYRLSQIFDRPVIDQTGLKDGFAFDLSFSDEPRPGAQAEALGATIFEALRDQLGLKLESRRTAVDIIVIDGAERPTEN